MKSTEDIRTFYEETLLTRLREREKTRRKGCIYGVLGFVGIFGFILLVAFIWPLLCLAPLVLPVLGWFIYRAESLGKRAGRDFKKQIIAPLVHFMDERLSYQEESKLNMKSLQKTHLFKKSLDGLFGSMRAEDQITGTFGETPFFACEVHSNKIDQALRLNTINPIASAGSFLVDEVAGALIGADGHVESSNKFHHFLYLRAECAKDFSSETLVFPVLDRNMWERFADGLCHSTLEGAQDIDVGEPNFHALFGVVGQDTQETQRMLSVNLRRLLVEYRNTLGRPIFMSFVGSTAHFVILHGRDMFEVKGLDDLSKFERIEEFVQELRFITDFVEALNEQWAQ